MLLYFLLILASLSGGLLPSKNQKTYLWTIGAFCWLLASLRYVTGFDYRMYETIFQTVAEAGLSGLSQIEPGYLLLNLLVSRLGGDYRVFLFLFHLLFLVLVFAWIGRYSSTPWISVYLFLVLQYLALSMNFLRQALAAAILLWIYPFLKQRRFLPSCGIILLASCFHWSALIMAPLSFLLCLRPSKRHYGLAGAAAGMAYLLDPLLCAVIARIPKYQHYLGGIYWQGNSVLYLLLPVGCFLFALPLIKQAVEEPTASPVLANSVFYSLLIQLFITRHFILERLSIYIAFFSLLALPEAALLPGRHLTAKRRTILLLAGGFAYFLFAASQGFHGVYPYRGIWDQVILP